VPCGSGIPENWEDKNVSFDYSQVNTLEEAQAILKASPDARPVAGATDIMVHIRAGKLKQAHLVDISGLEDLKGIGEVDGKIRIGALTVISDLVASELIREKAPALHQACSQLADPIVRNKATLGGNVANASPSADTVPALMALDANLIIASQEGERILPLCEYYKAYYVTDLAQGELIKAIEFKPNKLSGFEKLGLRNAMAISVVSAAAAVELDDEGRITRCLISMGAVAPYTVRTPKTEAFFVGKKLSPDLFEGLEDVLKEDIKPISDVRATEFYRSGVSAEIVKRAFLKFID